MQLEEGEESITNLAMWTPHVYDRVAAIREIIKATPIRHCYDSFHSLYADATGDAMVLELIDDEVVCTDIKDQFIVTTNFSNARLEDTPLEKLKEVPYGGADRYEAV